MMAGFAAKYAETTPFSSRAQLRFAVLLRENLEPIGSCDLAFVAKGGSHTQLGWHFSHRFKGLGYATEAARELVRVAFEECGVTRVVADCFESNAASTRIFQKLGMLPVPDLSIQKWILALKYLETRPIVRYAISSAGS
jgi:RimJ/RimL family protein N-acetyltransferase